MTIKDVFIHNLRMYRENAGLTQADLAKKLNLNPVTVSGWETGRKEPGFSVLEEMAAVYGIDVSDFFSDPAIMKIPQAETQADYILLVAALAASPYTQSVTLSNDSENGQSIRLNLGHFRNQDLIRKCEGALSLVKMRTEGILSIPLYESALRGVVNDIRSDEKRKK